MSRAGFRCPQCRQAALAIDLSLELPGDADWDEISVQTQACTACGLTAIALYREERRGAGEIWRHDGHRVSREDYLRLRALLAQCPDQKNRRCACATHRALQAAPPLTQVAVLDSFKVERVGA